jgi:hypothetical protein
VGDQSERVLFGNAARVEVEKFFGLDTLGEDMQGSAMHQTLLKAYDKLFAAA